MDSTIGRDRLRELLDLILASLEEAIDGRGIAARGCLSRYQFDRLAAAAIGDHIEWERSLGNGNSG